MISREWAYLFSSRIYCVPRGGIFSFGMQFLLLQTTLGVVRDALGQMTKLCKYVCTLPWHIANAFATRNLLQILDRLVANCIRTEADCHAVSLSSSGLFKRIKSPFLCQLCKSVHRRGEHYRHRSHFLVK